MLAACAAPAKEAAPVSPAITQADLDKVTQDQVAAMNTGDGAKAGAVYATDAVFVSARGAVETQAAITSFWTEAMKNGAGKDLKINIVKFGTSGDLAYTLSRFTGGITAPSGHVLAVSKRQADGSLKIVMQVSIPDPPAAKK
jgi:ketosteroid isomerase-like protein